MINRRSPGGAWRRVGIVAGAVVLTLAAGLAGASPASAQGEVGYVRLAHLSPDTPDVDVYLSKLNDPSFAPQVFRGVGYGVVSQYLPVPVGTYAVAMRVAGADPATPPVISNQVTVAANAAYTVAGTGPHASLGLTVLTDDLSAPGPNEAKVRVIQASIAAPVLNVSGADGTPIATGVAFATTTKYNDVAPGLWTLRVTPTGSSAQTVLTCQLRAGAVYSLLVLDGPEGLRAQLRIDAAGPGQPPTGAIEAGAGGTDGTRPAGLSPLVVVGGGLVVLVALLGIGLRARRLASRRS